MMRLSASGGHQFIPHFFRERDVYQVIAVDVPDFSRPEAEFRPTKTMRVSGHPRPTQRRAPNFFFSSKNWHPASTPPSVPIPPGAWRVRPPPARILRPTTSPGRRLRSRPPLPNHAPVPPSAVPEQRWFFPTERFVRRASAQGIFDF